MTGLTSRLATLDDLPALHALLRRAIGELQRDFLSPEQVEASHKVMGLDTQLLRDRTYFLVDDGERVVGCGGWSFRSTLYGGDDSIVAREPTRLEPSRDAAKVRAMYTHPDFARRGIGRQVLMLCEGAARNAGFRRVELMATMAGVPLYRACGYAPVEEVLSDPIGPVRIPLLRMRKSLPPCEPTLGSVATLVARFESGTLAASDWTHAAHVLVGLWYLLEHGREGAMEPMRRAILRHNEAVGTPNSETSGYHETLTWAFLQGVADFAARQQARGDDPFAAILVSELASADWPLRFYSRELLFSSQARGTRVVPDLAPIG